MYYMKLTLVMTTTGLFATNLGLFYNILTGVVTGILSIIPLTLIRVFLQSSFAILKYFGVFLTMVIVAQCYYLSMSSAALMEDESGKLYKII